jgi:hypothetical protein
MEREMGAGRRPPLGTTALIALVIAACVAPVDGGETPLDRLQAVLHCRRAFAATSADPA